MPSDKIEINSLSLLSLIKHKSNPKIIIKGKMTVIIFGIKYNDRNNISKISTWIKLVTVKSLVICKIHATDKNINKIKKKFFKIWVNR